MKKFLGSLAFAAAMLTSPKMVQAQFACDNVFYMSGVSKIGADQCKLYDGTPPTTFNDDNATVNSWLTSLSISAGYSIADKAESGSNTPPLTYDILGSTGTLTISPSISGPFVIALKGGPDMALFYFGPTHTGIGSLGYSTAGFTNKNGNQPGLSHASLYCEKGECGSTTVPEPASLALLATGMVGLVGIARRRRA